MPPSKRNAMSLAPTVAVAYSVYLLDAKSRNYAPGTIANIEIRVRRFVHWLALQNIDALSSISPTHVRQFLLERQPNVAETTLHTEARAIRAWLNWCVAESYIAVSPMPKMPRKPKLIKAALTPANLRALLRRADLRESAIVLALLDTGMRASELCSVNVSDIDIANGRVLVHGKMNKDRYCYIGARTVKALLRYWAASGIEQGAALRSERGNRRLTRSSLYRTIARMAQRNNLDGVSPHALRRTFAIFHLRNGVDIYTLAKLMGHEDIDTLKVYLDLVDTDAADAHRRYTLLDEL